MSIYIYNKKRSANEKRVVEDLFRRHYSPLVNYAQRMVHDKDQAEDTVQEVFTRLWDKRNDILFSGDIQSYLYRSVFTRCIDIIRHSKIHETFADKVLEERFLNTIFNTPAQEIELLNKDLRDIIFKAADKLPDKCRTIFIETKIKGRPQTDVAGEMGISVKTVENHITIAYTRLRKELGWLLEFFAFFSLLD